MVTSLIRTSFQTGFARNAYQSKRPDLWRGLVGAWKPSLGVTGTTLFDVSGNGNHGTLTNGVAWAGSERGHALDFDGVDDTILLSDPPDTSTNINNGSIFAWIKTSNAGTGYRGIIVKRLSYSIFLKNNIFLAFDFDASADRTTGVNLADSKWHHVGMTFQSGVSNGTKLYIDGTEKLTTTLTINNQSEAISIGNGNNAPATFQFFNGLIDDVRIYNRALSAEEIWDMYINPDEMFLLRRRVSYFVPAGVTSYDNTMSDGIKIGETISSLGSFLHSRSDGVKVGESVSSVQSFISTLTDGIKVGDSQSSVATLSSIITDGIKFSDSTSVASGISMFGDSLILGRKPLLGSRVDWDQSINHKMVGCWLMNESGGDRIADISLNGHHGTFATGTAKPTWDIGSFGRSVKFDGGDRIEIGNVALLDFENTDKITISLWVELTTIGVNNVMMSKRQGDHRGWVFYVNPGNALELVLQSGGVNRIRTQSTTTLTTNKQYHLVVTYDGSLSASNVQMYINKVRETTSVIEDTLTTTIKNSGTAMIGDQGNLTLPFNGFIDNVRVWRYRELTGSEVTNINIEPYKGIVEYTKRMFGNPGSSVYNYGVIDGISLSDLCSSNFNITVSVTEGMLFGDTETSIGIFNHTISDGVKFSDLVSNIANMFVSLSDGVLVGDSLSWSAEILVSISDGFLLGDSALSTASFLSAIIDGIAIGETTSSVAELFGSVVDGIKFSDIVTTTLQYLVSVTDGIEFSDTISGVNVTSLPNGEVKVTFTVKGSTVSFTVKTPSVTFEV